MKIRNLTIIAVLLCIFFLTSCSSEGSRRNELIEYRVGNQGLLLDFMPNSPPPSVFAEDYTFTIAAEVRNIGVYPGENEGPLVADIYFTGFDNRIITGLDRQSITFQSEESKTRYNPEGSMEVINLEAYIDYGYFQSSKIDSYDANINAIMCYPYKTYATIDVCVDPNPNKENYQDTCQPGVTSTGSQGAPVAVTSVESVKQKGKARFVITIANVGNGEVLRESAISQCIDVDLDREQYNKVALQNAQLSNGISLECTPSQEIRLIDGKAVFICKADLYDESTPAYKTILSFELVYGYKTSAKRTVSILGE